jgi:hypothetical protein
MTAILEGVSFALVATFFFGFGWHFSRVTRLWSTREYGGPTYIASFMKAMSSGVFLFVGVYLAAYLEIPDARRDMGMLICIPFAVVGWVWSLTHYRRREASRGEVHSELR